MAAAAVAPAAAAPAVAATPAAAVATTAAASGPALPAALLNEQLERAFQKQPIVFAGRKRVLGKKVFGRERVVHNVGLGFKTPRAAALGTFIDKKCPWVGAVSIRGRLIRGNVISTKMTRTIVVRREYLHWVKKYQRYEKRHTNIPAHCSPALPVRDGDTVIIGQCRPLSKTVRFNVLKIVRRPGVTIKTGGKKVFTGF